MADLTPLELSEEELDQLAIITDQDVLAANSFIIKAVDRKYKNLILAKDQGLAEAEATNAQPA